jgi:hypothetical protein
VLATTFPIHTSRDRLAGLSGAIRAAPPTGVGGAGFSLPDPG